MFNLFKKPKCRKCGISLQPDEVYHTAMLIIPNGRCNHFGRPDADFIENPIVCFHCKNHNEGGEQCR